jgi:hypothetical protein
MCIAWARHIVTKVLLFHTYYSCAGSVIGSCTHNHTIYQVCAHDNQFTCFNPTYCPVEQWLELSIATSLGTLLLEPRCLILKNQCHYCLMHVWP